MKRVTGQQALFVDAAAAVAPHRIAPAEPERERVELAARCRERFGKAAAAVCDATLRDDGGNASRPNRCSSTLNSR